MLVFLKSKLADVAFMTAQTPSNITLYFPVLILLEIPRGLLHPFASHEGADFAIDLQRPQ